MKGGIMRSSCHGVGGREGGAHKRNQSCCLPFSSPPSPATNSTGFPSTSSPPAKPVKMDFKPLYPASFFNFAARDRRQGQEGSGPQVSLPKHTGAPHCPEGPEAPEQAEPLHRDPAEMRWPLQTRHEVNVAIEGVK